MTKLHSTLWPKVSRFCLITGASLLSPTLLYPRFLHTWLHFKRNSTATFHTKWPFLRCARHSSWPLSVPSAGNIVLQPACLLPWLTPVHSSVCFSQKPSLIQGWLRYSMSQSPAHAMMRLPCPFNHRDRLIPRCIPSAWHRQDFEKWTAGEVNMYSFHYLISGLPWAQHIIYALLPHHSCCPVTVLNWPVKFCIPETNVPHTIHTISQIWHVDSQTWLTARVAVPPSWHSHGKWGFNVMFPFFLFPEYS